MTAKIKPVVLVILDGWGHREEREHNAIAEAKTPFFDHLWKDFPHSLLNASEGSVGLPEGQMGNSEVGHMTIGAGTVIDTDLVRIVKAMRAGDFVANPSLQGLYRHCLKYDSTLHVIGMVSPGGVHSHSDHLYGFLEAAKQAGIKNVAIHVVTDGRDTPPKAGAGYVEELEKFIAEHGIGRIATAAGRFYSMDRDKNWDRIEKAETAMRRGESDYVTGEKPSDFIRKRYTEGSSDEVLEPIVFLDGDGRATTIKENDGVFMFNFRADRVRLLARRLREHGKKENIHVVTMTESDRELDCPIVYPQVDIKTTLAAEVSRAGLSQVHIAETEKYAHVTYFLNGGREKPHEGEERILVDTRKDVKMHDEAPEMRAREITDAAIERMSMPVDFIVLNYANVDLVGHTANMHAVITAVETVDRELNRLVGAVSAAGGATLITADHGNAEVNIDPVTGEKHTAHTTNMVPAIVTLPGGTMRNGSLADIAPTVLTLMGLPVPPAMTGKSLYTAE